LRDQNHRAKKCAVARWLDGVLADHQPYVAGTRFTVADITTFVELEFARGLMKFSAGDEGMPHLQAYYDRWLERASARVFSLNLAQMLMRIHRN